MLTEPQAETVATALKEQLGADVQFVLIFSLDRTEVETISSWPRELTSAICAEVARKLSNMGELG